MLASAHPSAGKGGNTGWHLRAPAPSSQEAPLIRRQRWQVPSVWRSLSWDTMPVFTEQCCVLEGRIWLAVADGSSAGNTSKASTWAERGSPIHYLGQTRQRFKLQRR